MGGGGQNLYHSPKPTGLFWGSFVRSGQKKGPVLAYVAMDSSGPKKPAKTTLYKKDEEVIKH